jgi:putative PIN family toxin of toxin-antitoxin system
MRRSRDAGPVAIDTNLFVSGAIIKKGVPFALLESWRRGDFVVLLSPMQDAELRDVFARPKLLTHYGMTDSDVTQFFNDLTRLTLRAPLLASLPLEVRDTKDEMILATALGNGASHIVTGDNDLLTLAGDPRLGTLQIVAARAFLDFLATRSQPGKS